MHFPPELRSTGLSLALPGTPRPDEIQQDTIHQDVGAVEYEVSPERVRVLDVLPKANLEELRTLLVGSSIRYSIHLGPDGEDVVALGRNASHPSLGPSLYANSVRRDTLGDQVYGDRWCGLRRTGEITVFSTLTWRATAARLIGRFTDCRVNRFSDGQDLRRSE
ncbi:hypothetical protein AB0D66_31350 [Streptomyces sp. NPDC048270]|uniref:hypothetical protein n=1 Tax=Streptomyces sp. NPDC048270 TaxID=3154615 RepID=UPI0033C189EE